MSRRTAVDEARILWAAALVEGLDPAELLVTVDVGALAAVVADADTEVDAVDAAAALLVAMVRRRPFPAANAAIGWLAGVELLRESRLRIEADAGAVVALCERITAGGAALDEVRALLRAWLVEDGIPCPACGRRVYADDPGARHATRGAGGGYELRARCAVEHGGHDREGRPVSPPPARPAASRQPVLARGTCGSFLVADEAGGVAVSPFSDEPPLVRVVQVGELRAGDLVGRWDGLVRRSTTLGFVPAGEAAPDESDLVDLARLARALRHGRRHLAGAGVGAESSS